MQTGIREPKTTDVPRWPTGNKEKSLSAETMNGLAGKSVPFPRNIKLSSTDHGCIRYVPFSNLFSKNLSFWRRGCSDYICLYSNQTPPPTLLPLSLSNTFEGHGYCGWGVNRTGQRLKTTPARFF